MNASPAPNFDQARAAVTGSAGMQSNFVAVPGASSSVQGPSMSFPNTASAMETPPPLLAPDISMQATLPTDSLASNPIPMPPVTPNPTFEASETPFSSATTPVPPPQQVAPSQPPTMLAPKKILSKRWTLSRKMTTFLIVVLVGIGLIVFVYSFLNRPATQPGKQPENSSRDVVVHLAQGSALELQGLKDLVSHTGADNVSGIKEDIAAMQKKLDNIDSNQKTLSSDLEARSEDREDYSTKKNEGFTSGEGYKPWNKRHYDDYGDSKKKVDVKRHVDVASPGQPSKGVHYSADLAMQGAEPKRSSTDARWVKDAPARFYGDGSVSQSPPIHFSDFDVVASHREHVYSGHKMCQL